MCFRGVSSPVAVLVGGTDVALGLIVVLNIAGANGETQVKEIDLGGMAIVRPNCLSIPLCLVGVGLAIAALVAHKSHNHLFTDIGLGVNALVILGVLGLYVFVSVSKH